MYNIFFCYDRYLVKLVIFFFKDIPFSPDTNTRHGYLWLYEAKLPRIKMYGIDEYFLIYRGKEKN